METTCDFTVIGGGIIGLSTAMQLIKKYPHKKLILIEKETKLACHQTGHNSGVIHAGVYYEPGSLKSKFCKLGVEATIKFCTEHQIPYEQCGKLLVATNSMELERMSGLYERCKKNGLKPEILDKQALKILEPNINGLGAIKVKETGIIDYISMSECMARIIKKDGGIILLKSEVSDIIENKKEVLVKLKNNKTIKSKFLIACGGLQSDRLAKMAGLKIDYKIIPFRGEYFGLNKKHNNIVNHLIYPIPDPKFPFLGVHLTKMIDGSVTVGPNAVLNISREGYRKYSMNLKDLLEMVLFKGFWKFLKQNWKPGIKEIYSSISKKSYLKICQKYCPSLQLSDLEPYRSGIRAQAVSKEGKLIHDFLVENSNRTLHVCNAPSPAATSSLPIGKYIVDLLENKMKEIKNAK